MTISDVTHPSVKTLTPEERIQASLRVAMSSSEKLIAWMEASGRTWIVFNSRQLIEALPWPEGVSAFAQIIAAYRDHRSTIPTGDTETIDGVVVPKYHTETLTVTELDRAIRFLIAQASAIDPMWSLGRDPA